MKVEFLFKPFQHETAIRTENNAVVTPQQHKTTSRTLAKFNVTTNFALFKNTFVFHMFKPLSVLRFVHTIN